MKKMYTVICILAVLLTPYLLVSIIILNNNPKQQQDFYDKRFEVPADGSFIAPEQQVEWNKLSCTEKKEFLERLVMINFSPLIIEAVNKYYGELRGYDLENITDVKVMGYEYEIKIQITTFVGPHNPALQNILKHILTYSFK